MAGSRTQNSRPASARSKSGNSGLLSGPRPAKNRSRNPFWRFRRFLLLIFLFGFGLLLGGIALLAREELPEDDFAALAQTSFVCSAEVAENCNADNAAVALSGGEDRIVVDYDQIPQVVIDAVVATEDNNFFNDRIGIDPLGIARALYQNTREGRAAQGGSTITQQYVKNAFAIDADRNIVTKLKEATLAVKLTQQLSREEILGRYLNRIYFGRGAYGVQAAARNYFDRDVEDLTLSEAAYLAGLIRAPSSADAKLDPEEANRRRATTLVRMVADGYISQADADAVNAVPIETHVIDAANREGLGSVEGSSVGSTYFYEAVRQQLVALEGEIGQVYSGGLRVYTTLDPELQAAAWSSVIEVLQDPGTNPDTPVASIVAVDNNGQVQAMVGGYDFSTSQVNLALGQDGGGSGRQPGSSFKTFALVEAIEQQISARSLFAAPTVIEIPGANDGGVWTVRGGGSQDGYRDLIDALRVSSNVVYAQLMVNLNAATVVDTAHDLGVSAELPEVNALVLGSGEVSVLDMAVGYATIANQGERFDPVLIERIENADGEVICWYPTNGQCGASPRVGVPAIAGSTARQATFALEQVVSSGTGQGAQFGQPAAGKTGTTQDARDAWFVGFTCDFTAAVWMGYAGAPGEPVRTMSDFRGAEVHGGDYPADIWSTFMAKATLIRGGGSPYPCESLPVETQFPGTILNTNLSTTTLPPCTVAAPEDPTAATVEPGNQTDGEGDGDGDGVGEGDGGAATTAPCTPVTADPDEPATASTTEDGEPIPDPTTAPDSDTTSGSVAPTTAPSTEITVPDPTTAPVPDPTSAPDG